MYNWITRRWTGMRVLTKWHMTAAANQDFLSPFIATQLNSTQLDVELSWVVSWVALDTLYDARRRASTGVERHAASQC